MAEMSDKVLGACERLVDAIMRSFSIDSTYAVRVALLVFCAFAGYWLAVTSGVPSRLVLYCLVLTQYCTGFVVLLLNPLGA